MRGVWYAMANMTERRPVIGAGMAGRPDRPASGSPQARSAVVAFALLLGGAAASIFLVGHAEQGNLGVFLLCAGAAMIGCPPLTKTKPAVAAAAAAFLLCSALALLPARLFHVPVWRQVLADAPALPLPETVSAAPWQTIFWLEVLAVTVLTGLFTLTQVLRSRALSAFALAGAGVCGLYAALSVVAKTPGWSHSLSSENTFGFFPNRNHTATLLVIGSVLSIGILGVAYRQRQRLALNAAVASLTLCVAGLLFFSESRGGVVFLIVGLGGWLAGLGGHLNRRLLVAVAVVVVVGGGLFLTLKGRARDRLLNSLPMSTGGASKEVTSPEENAVPEKYAGGITSDDRLRITPDTLRMIRDVPWTGSGLGTFALVFAPYRQTSANGNLALHPESDWLMVAAETGLPAFACLGGLIALILAGWRPEREHPYWPLRWALLMAVGAAALYGLFDVPAHRAALGWWMLVLAGLALQPGRISAERYRAGTSGGVARSIFVLGGLLAVSLGGMLVYAEWFGGRALPPYAARVAQREVARTFEQGDLEGAIEQARQATRNSPLDSPLYYELGVLLARVMDTDAEIDRAFRLERLLSPWAPRVARSQALVWMPLDSPRSAALFSEALEREERLQRISGRNKPVTGYWKSIVEQASGFPAVQNLLWVAGTSRGVEFTVTWLETADARLVKERLAQVAADTRFLSQLNAQQKERLVSVWKTKGDPSTLPMVLESGDGGSPK